MNWQDTYFDETYRAFYEGILTPERTEQEVNFLVSIFDKDTKTILDMPCGYGRHALLLAQRGYAVTGVDFYDSQLSPAKQSARDPENPTFIHADMREAVFPNHDVALNLFSSFGYFTRDEDARVFANLVASVKPGGQIILDVRNPERYLKAMEDAHYRTEVQTDFGTEIETLDPQKMMYTLHYERNGDVKEATMNLYMSDDFKRMFSENNCVIERQFGNYKGDLYDPKQSRRLILVARKGGA